MLLSSAPALASFHEMSIREVFAGSASEPDAQYVMLQMYSAGQNFVSSHSVTVYNRNNVSVGTYTFTSSVANGSNQATILVATPEAEASFGITADLEMTATLTGTGGKVCFDSIDCVSWGDFTGTVPEAGDPAPAIPAGSALTRSLKGNGTLEQSDDTDDSATDFAIGPPAPLNNAGAAALPGVRIHEMFAGTAAAPTASYVVLRAFTGGQTATAQHQLRVYNASGALTSTTTFGANVTNGGSQSTVLIANSAAATFFNVPADFTLAAALPAAGGKVCLDARTDCVSWGSYSGSSEGSGNPFAPSTGLGAGWAMTRLLGANGQLDAVDDTDVSSADFQLEIPGAINNAGQTGIPPAASCGDGVLGGLEQCDDHNQTSNDGCDSNCRPTPGWVVDAGADAGGAADAGQDAGSTSDAGALADAGPDTDAGHLDAPDAGPGEVKEDDPPPGCGCGETGPVTAALLGLFVAVLGVRSRRRVR